MFILYITTRHVLSSSFTNLKDTFTLSNTANYPTTFALFICVCNELDTTELFNGVNTDSAFL